MDYIRFAAIAALFPKNWFVDEETINEQLEEYEEQYGYKNIRKYDVEESLEFQEWFSKTTGRPYYGLEVNGMELIEDANLDKLTGPDRNAVALMDEILLLNLGTKFALQRGYTKTREIRDPEHMAMDDFEWWIRHVREHFDIELSWRNVDEMLNSKWFSAKISGCGEFNTHLKILFATGNVVTPNTKNKYWWQTQDQATASLNAAANDEEKCSLMKTWLSGVYRVYVTGTETTKLNILGPQRDVAVRAYNKYLSTGKLHVRRKFNKPLLTQCLRAWASSERVTSIRWIGRREIEIDDKKTLVEMWRAACGTDISYDNTMRALRGLKERPNPTTWADFETDRGIAGAVVRLKY